MQHAGFCRSLGRRFIHAESRGFVLLFALGMTAGLHAAPPDSEAPRPSATAKRLVGSTPIVPADSKMPRLPIDQEIGSKDFTVGLSFRADDPFTTDLGDLVSLWDSASRNGFTLGLRNNTGCTSSQSNWRQLQFGLDAGTEPTWREEGRPGSALLGFALCVHRGHLYVATCEPGKDDAGKVYRYEGPGRWKDLGRLDGANSVTSLASFDGHLYAGTGKYRLRGSALAESENTTVGGRIYRLSKEDRWEPAGQLGSTEAVGGLVNYGGRLYATSLYPPAGFFRYEGGDKWTSLPTPGGKRVVALGVHGGALYASSYDGGRVYRFDGSNWADLGLAGEDNTQTYSFATYLGRLQVGTWPSGKVYRLDSGDRWADAGRLGQEHEVMGMLVHNGAFYAGSLPKAEVYRWDEAGGEGRWSLLKQLDTTPDVKYRRAWTMATYRGRMFVTTLPSGKIWSMQAGACVTDDGELGPGWHDLVAQRNGGRLRLFVDGRLSAESEPNAGAISLTTRGRELVVGNGPRGAFPGQVRDVWFELPKP